MKRGLTCLLRDESGAALVEMSVVMTMFLVVTFGLVEFAFALWQWNSASKATQLGARLAAVSAPVWSELKSEEVTGAVGGSVPAFDVECSGATGACAGSDAGAGATFDAAALATIVKGRDGVCKAVGADGFPGMCDVFFRVAPENVVVRYYNSGLGFAGRPGGPVPTITVRLTGLQFDFVVLNALLGFGAIMLPDFEATMTGEDLCVQSPASC